MVETLTNARTKLIKSLKLKKNRKEEGLFVVEGVKNVLELLDSDYEVHSLYGSLHFLESHASRLKKYSSVTFKTTNAQLASVSSFKSNDNCIALAKIKQNQVLKIKIDEFALMLDDVNDPGNLGTIIRICDWYGINKIIASEETVDLYNPKVIAGSMGSFTRVSVYYTPLEKFIKENSGPYFGTFMSGENAHTFDYGSGGYIVMGNESNGIHKAIEPWLDKKLSIPSFGKAESLNVAIASAIILDNIRR